MPFYSQHLEDEVLAYLLPQSAGTCVEVGANDGVTYSTTKHFEEKGWKCVLIEPAPSLCEKIRQSRTGQLYQCAASDRVGETTFRFMPSQPMYSSLEARPTMHEEFEAAPISELRVKTRRLDDILDEAGVRNIDFITVDVEGHELSALAGFSLARWHPSVIIVEDRTDLGETAVSAFIRQSGYRRFYRSGGNDWYAQEGQVPIRKMAVLAFTGKVKLSGLLKSWLPGAIRKQVVLGARKIRDLMRA